MLRPFIALLFALSSDAHAATYYVAAPPLGNDAFPGTFEQPWATLQHAGSNVIPGDIVEVRAGSYAGMNLARSGAEGFPLVFRPYAGETVLINTVAPGTQVGFNVDGRAHVRIERFFIATGNYGVRVVLSDHVEVRANRITNATTSGILGGLADDLTIEDNVVVGSVNDAGILGLDSGARWTVRNNTLSDNAGGISLNGDPANGSTGTFTQVVLDSNRIRVRNGVLASGVQLAGVQGARVVNNLAYNVPRFGIILFASGPAGASTGNAFLHNAVVLLDTARFAFYAQDAATGTVLRNNVLLHPTASGNAGAIQLTTDSLPGLSSDHNAVANRMALVDDMGVTSFMTLAQWQAQQSQDAASVLASTAMFVSSVSEDFRLSAGSAAIDAGEARPDVATDRVGTTRPQGNGWDIGSDEFSDALFASGFES